MGINMSGNNRVKGGLVSLSYTLAVEGMCGDGFIVEGAGNNLGECGSVKAFSSVRSAIAWMKGLHKELFISVVMTDGKGNVVSGYNEIIHAFNYNEDLYCADSNCIHLHTESGVGGGCHCTTCSGWFCY